MPEIHPIPAVTFAPATAGEDLSDRIAPPYDVLDEQSKAALLKRNDHNIVAIDLPHLPAKTVGPDATYEKAGQQYRQWLKHGILRRWEEPAIFVYQQTYTVDGQTFARRGLIADVPVQPFGKGPGGRGGVYPHEQTFSGPKEDRLKLMRATQAQLSPIFGLYSDPDNQVAPLLGKVAEAGNPDFKGNSADGVLHEVWAVKDENLISQFRGALGDKPVFIADGHHRYTTALNYKNELEAAGRDVGNAGVCLFVLVSMQDPGMIVLPTHRVLGNMNEFSLEAFTRAAQGKLDITPFEGKSVEALEQAVKDDQRAHAFGLYVSTGEGTQMAIATTVEDDPLAQRFPDKSDAWRHLDVAILQHMIVEEICEPRFCSAGENVAWKFPHSLDQFERDAQHPDYQLGIVVRATPLDSVRKVSEAGELMPQKSTFFYPKLATGLVINPLD